MSNFDEHSDDEEEDDVSEETNKKIKNGFSGVFVLIETKTAGPTQVSDPNPQFEKEGLFGRINLVEV